MYDEHRKSYAESGLGEQREQRVDDEVGAEARYRPATRTPRRALPAGPIGTRAGAQGPPRSIGPSPKPKSAIRKPRRRSPGHAVRAHGSRHRHRADGMSRTAGTRPTR